MGNPAARIGDSHFCPATTPVQHDVGKIIGRGIASVIIGGQKAAVLDVPCACIGKLNKIISASTSVLFKGRPAAREGDMCAHGGKIITGCPTVLIGGTLPGNLEVELADRIQWTLEQEIRIAGEKKFRLMPTYRRALIINQALQDAIGLLRKKLKLFKKRDTAMMKQFKKWFGTDEVRSKELIVQRIKRELKFIKKLSGNHFWNIKDEELRDSEFAFVKRYGNMYFIFVGDLFLQAGRYGKNSRAGILIHEISHCKHIGDTKDYAYEKFGCLALVSMLPGHALENADNYEFFIES